MIKIQSVVSYFWWYIRPLVKWFLRKTTNFCELQRICYGNFPGARRTLAVENSLLMSRHPVLRELPYLREQKKKRLPHRAALLYAITSVTTIKKINTQVHVSFTRSMSNCIQQIWGYLQLVREIEELRQTQYDCQNPWHEKKLLKLWALLVPDIKLDARITKQWQYIGFQGDDPKTDFRGMGILGLENLLFFASEYTSAAQGILIRSQHPKHGYAFAIVGINLTHLAYYLVKDGAAKTHLYNSTRYRISLSNFHRLYSYLYIEFHKFWTFSKPNNIMDFSFIWGKFEKNIRDKLKNPKTVLGINFVDCV